MLWRIVLAFPVILIITCTSFYGSATGKSHGFCNHTFLEKTGSFYPNNATNATTFHCEYNITNTKVKGPICVFFSSLFMDPGDEVNFYSDQDSIKSGKKLTETIRAQNGSVTVITGLDSVFIVYTGHNPHYIRNFEGFYSHECIIPVSPDVEILQSPIYAAEAPKQEVQYFFNEIQHKRVKQAFTFLEYNMATSTVTIEDSTSPGEYTNKPPCDFFPHDTDPVKFHVTMSENSTDKFTLKITEVDKTCSEYFELGDSQMKVLKSPPELLNNGTILPECRWIIRHKDTSKILGLTLDTLDFHSVFDIVAINNGMTEISPPLFQVTVSNKNISKTQMYRSGATGPYLWISFKPVSYASRFVANLTIHGQGGYMKNEGKLQMHPTTGDDTGFLLEVKVGEVVMLSFEESSFKFPATLSLYDGFETKKENLLATLHGQINYPILSKTSRMMVIGSKFSDSSSHFTASFKGVSPSCNQMSTLTSGNYILSENCNSTCTWAIPPQDVPNSDMIVFLQYRSLKAGDKLEINKLDTNMTQLGVITAETGHVPPVAVPANVGALVKVTQSSCKVKTDKIVLVGHSNLLPGQNINIAPKPSDVLQISSPLYPDYYPVFSSIQWNITAPKDTFFHVAFIHMKLAQNHCIRFAGKNKYEFEGDVLPEDLFLNGDLLVQFDSTNCGKKSDELSLMSDEGFLLNITVAECGEVMTGKTGEFNTSMIGSHSVCVWKIDVRDKDSVRAISYSLSRKDSLTNQEFIVYDGASVRNVSIINETNTDIMTHAGVLIFKYIRLNISAPSATYVFKYSTIVCNSSMQCDNRVCMHPDWRCNGQNDCGDFSDERNCAAVPIPKNVTLEGYSSLAFWMCIFGMLLFGFLVGITAPTCYQRYKDSRYSRFRELSGIDG